MKKEIIICALVIFFVIIGNIITQNNTKQAVKSMNEELNKLKSETNENVDSGEKIKGKLEDVKNKWDEIQENLSFYIEHDELEKIETELALTEGKIEANLYNEVIPEIEKCIFILNHIEDKTALKIQNVF